MSNKGNARLADEAERRIAMASHERSLLVEAGAGSGKTALMAGRIALMLAHDIHPKHIAAVTFTELAASELLIRVRELVGELLRGSVPGVMQLALPEGLSEEQVRSLTRAAQSLDEITCSTIHGFCQRLIKPYPVEANIDPGAAVMDNNEADLSFREISDTWLRRQLDRRSGTLLSELVHCDTDATMKLVDEILGQLRRHRHLTVVSAPAPAGCLTAFLSAVHDFTRFLASAGADEPETTVIGQLFARLADEIRPLQLNQAADLVQLLQTPLPPRLCRTDGVSFLAYRRKTAWKDAAKRSGMSKIDGDRLAQAAEEHYNLCCEAWEALREATASHVLDQLVKLLQPVMDAFTAHKRKTARLDFNDLIFAARDLLRDHEAVRVALSRRYAHVLVDEFQDTDPLQTEIFWRLCGEPGGSDWTTFRIRPGALFLVGDPKQAIYRFRGADVAAYVQAREVLKQQDPGAVLSISTNFRSRAPILAYVNDRFRAKLSEPGQPGFTALQAHHPERGLRPCVAALDISCDSEKEELWRDLEAEAVAELCARLIGAEQVADPRSGQRPCRPGDIALLAPTGTDLWRYEAALERRGIAVATQAGKGFYKRQEIQDLIALTRVLANGRDTLALGALLRGPLVGLTEEALLDLVWALPRDPKEPDELPRLHMQVEGSRIQHPLARHVLQTLQSLRLNVNTTTPYDLLSQAVAQLRVRAILMQRHRDQAERALANVDRYLTLARPYAVRGLRAFSEAMTAAWKDESRAGEGRPDAQEEAVALYTMHASKGLEWPIVVPINTMTQIAPTESGITDRNGVFHCPIFKVRPKGYAEARESEKEERNRERIRLWYVATTRARELLVLPRHTRAARPPTWNSLVELRDTLDPFDLSALPAGTKERSPPPESAQSSESFREEARRIYDLRHSIKWQSPSREEGPKEGDEVSTLQVEEAQILAATEAIPGITPQTPAEEVQGGRERGLVLHKLLEEVLTGETLDTEDALTERAAVLIQQVGRDDIVPKEVAGCVVRTLALPEVSSLRPRLQAEYPVYAVQTQPGEELVTVGIADAIAFDEQGAPEVIIDWKSDLHPTDDTLKHYRRQVGEYLLMTGAARGLIILVTEGRVIPVMRPG